MKLYILALGLSIFAFATGQTVGTSAGRGLPSAGPTPVQDEAASPAAAASYNPRPKDLVKPAGLPKIGKWMISPSLQPADWLGAIYEGKRLKEPINILILDKGATSVADAKSRLTMALANAGFPSRTGPSGGYSGYIAGELYPQLPAAPDHAFSDGVFLLDNNHGRIFGLYPHTSGYLFISAMSREKVDPLAKVKRQYDSFNRARDELARNLSERTNYRTVRFAALENALVNDPRVTTSDHDGAAALIIVDE